jgi:DNA uptake protein ComE-like DNA-binding protein
MNLQLSNRRQDLSVRLGNHGYRLDGDYAWLNADLHVPPYCSGSDFGLELWACSAAYVGGDPQGVRVAEITLDFPTPIGPHVHRVEARAAILPPLGNADHAMVLMLVGNTGDSRRIHDFANYGNLQQFSNPHFGGTVGYAIAGEQAILSASSVDNPRSEGNTSGTLGLELWALSEPYAGGAPRGQRLAAAELGSISGQYHLPGVELRSAFAQPASGRWHVALLLREWTLASGYVTRDYRNFDVMYEQAAAGRESSDGVKARAATDEVRRLEPAIDAASDAVISAPAAAISAAAPAPTASAAVKAPAVASVPAAAPAAPSASAHAAAVKATAVASVPAAAPAAPSASAPAAAPASASAVKAPAPTPVVAAAAPAAAAAVKAPAPAPTPVVVAAAPAPAAPAPAAPVANVSAPAKSGVLNVHTASLEELSKLPGLSLKVAKDIVKARPFASLEALGEVRGVGDKTLRRIRNLIRL